MSKPQSGTMTLVCGIASVVLSLSLLVHSVVGWSKQREELREMNQRTLELEEQLQRIEAKLNIPPRENAPTE